MKHIMFADKSLLMSDDACDVLIDYATALANAGRADNVTLTAIDGGGNEVEVTFLLNVGTNIVGETTSSDLIAPDNDAAIAYMQERIDQLVSRPPVQPIPPEPPVMNDLD